MTMDNLIIEKAREHNLKNVSVKIPKNTITVITGPSGSGKSSLAFDTIYSEGQRRYIESLSSYARQFLGNFQPAKVDRIEGLSPAIAIDQKTTSKNPRSTVGTITEIMDYLRVLFSRVGDFIDPDTGKRLKKYSPTSIASELIKLNEGAKLFICFEWKSNPNDKLIYIENYFSKNGFRRFFYNENEILIEDKFDFKKYHNKEILIVLDRILLKKDSRERIANSSEQALKFGQGKCVIKVDNNFIEYNEKYYLSSKKIFVPEMDPRYFSFNSPLGACVKCNGLGISKGFSERTITADKSLPLLEGAIPLLSKKNNFIHKMIQDVLTQEKQSIRITLKDIDKNLKRSLFYGSDKVYKFSFKSKNSKFEFKKPFSGIIPWLEKKYIETASEKVRKELETYMEEDICSSCNGKRLSELPLLVKISGFDINQIGDMQVDDCISFFQNLHLTSEKEIIAEKLLKEIKSRLSFLSEVGLGYLTLNRSSQSLSGGESQRIRLATQIGSALTGIIYVLDEPSIGLHPKDTTRLISTLKHLRDLKNTVIVVEHDEETIENADYVIDLGPGSGIHGGQIIAQGTIPEIKSNPNSITAKYLHNSSSIQLDKGYTFKKCNYITIKKANCHNIKDVNFTIPLNGLICVSGVSGSGKSTLLEDILVPALDNNFSGSKFKQQFESISGLENISSYILLNQNPIGRTPHSNLATYTGIFDLIREVFSNTIEAKTKGYGPGRFSFNVKGGRCEECEGNGIKRIEMHFLPDVFVTCNECQGTRYNQETLNIYYKNKNISQILNSSVEENLEFFKHHPKISRTLKVLLDIGLGYLNLGQPATTLSGGEAQRLKLAKELSRRVYGSCLYILDEPTTGLHASDVKVLLKALLDLVELGHTVFVIEHNLHIIKHADHIIDLGPGGGMLGGKIVAQGTPEEIIKIKNSYTGEYLRKFL